MNYTFKLSRRIARLRALLFGAVLALVACDGSDSLDPSANTEPGVNDEALTPLEASAAFAGGIPFGHFHQPTNTLGGRYNGALRVISASSLLPELAEIRARGGRVVLSLVGNDLRLTDGNGHFDMGKWKARVDRYRGVDFTSYINDGTIIGHYMIDEPNDPTNWNGRAISQAMVEEMARYSKQLWPGMMTIVRAEPGYMDDWSGTYRYLDAAWAQYVTWKGTADDYLRRNVADASRTGLGLIVGLNIRRGGVNQTPMTAAQVKSFGTALLSSAYPCAFIMWEYDAGLLGSSAMQAAMDALRGQAQNRSARTCRGQLGSNPPPPPPPPPPSEPPAPPPPPGVRPLPFGLAYSSVDEPSTRWTGAQYEARPTFLVERLRQAQSSGSRTIVKLVGTAQSRNADGTFSLTRWKAQVDAYRRLQLGPYISSGAFYLHYLVEQPSCASCWGGRAIPWQTVEEMARYSKSIWPTLPTVVRVAPSRLAQASFRWNHLDAGWIEYHTGRGDLRTDLAREVSRAREEGLSLVAGLNLLDGAGYKTPGMTPSQVRDFGTILAAHTSVCALIGWRHDASYLSQRGMREALDAVAAVARSRSGVRCATS